MFKFVNVIGLQKPRRAINRYPHHPTYWAIKIQVVDTRLTSSKLQVCSLETSFSGDRS